jgi:hypothetical protein
MIKALTKSRLSAAKGHMSVSKQVQYVQCRPLIISLTMQAKREPDKLLG